MASETRFFGLRVGTMNTFIRSTVGAALAVALSLASVSSAQGGSSAGGSSAGGAARFLPQNPMFLLEMEGPAKMAESFAETNWGAMLKSQEAADLWARSKDGVRDDLTADDEFGLTPEMLEQLEKIGAVLLGYGGRVSAGATIVGLEEMPEGEPEFVFTVVVEDDGSDSLTQMLEIYAELMADWEGPVAQRVLADGTEVDVLTDVESLGEVLPPQMIGGYLVFGAGQDAEWLSSIGAAEEALSDDAAETVEGAAARAPLRLEMTSAPFEAFAKLLATDESEQGAMMMETFGPLLTMVSNMQGTVVTLRPRGAFVESNFVVSYDATERNLGTLLAPEGRIELLDVAPRSSGSSTALSLNIDEILGVVDEVAAGAGHSIDELEDEAESMLGIRFRSGLLDLLDGRLLTVSRGDADYPETVTAGYVLGVKDTEAVAKSVDIVLRKRGLHVSRKSEDYRDKKVSKLNFLGIKVEWALTDGFLVVAFGQKPSEMLRSLVDGIDDRKAGKKPPAWSERIRERLAVIGDDWQWLNVADAGDDIETFMEAMEAEIDAYGDLVPNGLLDLVTSGMEIMVKHDLFVSAVSTRFEPGKMIVRGIQ